MPSACWWQLLTVDKEFLPNWRESKFRGGCAHAGELETSIYRYLDGDSVQTDKIRSGTISFNEEKQSFTVDRSIRPGACNNGFVDKQLQ